MWKKKERRFITNFAIHILITDVVFCHPDAAELK